MKPFALGLGLLGVACAVLSSYPSERPTTFVVTGDLQGHLEPCGCTSPMSGGIKRQATLIRRLQRTSDVVLLSNGAMSGGTKPQDILKLQMLAEAWGSLSIAGINLSPEDAKLSSRLSDVDFFSHGKLLSGSLEPNPRVPIHATSQAGPVLIGAATVHPENLARPLQSRAIAPDDAIRQFVSDATQQSLVPALLLDGNEDGAKKIAHDFPALRLIVYRSTGDPPATAFTIGQTLLVTPGEQGKFVVRLSFDGKGFAEYQAVSLGPSFADDPQVSGFYREYLSQVDKGGFLEREPRHPSGPFAGSEACGSCHKADLKIWQHSKHARAFASLEAQGHARDPDCVSCHVVGLSSMGGFRSRVLTPNLCDVGCESCHGPSALHARNPKQVRLPKVGIDMCTSCHTSEQSPNFKASSFWQHIQHR